MKKSDTTVETSENAPQTAPEAFLKKPGALEGLQRGLKDADLKNPAVSRMLLDRGDKLEQENKRLREYEAKYHERDRDAAVCETQLTTFRQSVGTREIVGTAGGLLVGSLPSFWGHWWAFWPAGIVGIVLLGIAFIHHIKNGSKN
jgi:hypothetical protein